MTNLTNFSISIGSTRKHAICTAYIYKCYLSSFIIQRKFTIFIIFASV